MELSINHKPDLVVALDVGSTYSGYAWQWRDDFEKNKGNVEFNTDWGYGAPQLHKTMTALLLKVTYDHDVSPPKQTVTTELFGYEAERRYGNLCSDPDHEKEKDDYYLFKKFKLMLYRFRENMDGPRDPEVEDSNCRLWPLKDVISRFIYSLCHHFLEKHGQGVNPDSILWVLTVPALWCEKAKKFMRDAAEQSGIPKKQLLLATEPEAASIYCIHLPRQQLAVMNNVGQPGHIFLSVDLGGGTADLSVVEVLKDGFLKEVSSEQGVLVGGQNVNEAFFQTCNDSFEGTEWTRTMTKASPTEMLKLEQEFESLKVCIGSGNAVDELITLQLPKNVQTNIKAKTIRLKPSQSQDIVLKEDELKFKSSFIRNDLFKQSCKLIYTTIERVLKRVAGVQTVVLVGGFAESKIVQDNLKDMLREKFPDVSVVVPTSPFRAVLKGAVLYGHDTFIFRSRISRATYGVKITTTFDEQVHKEEKKILHKDEGRFYCKDVFSVHVRKGQTVKLNEKQPEKVYVPMFKQSRQISIDLYERDDCPSEAEILYVTDEGCRKIGEIMVDLPAASGDVEREVKVTMVYGGTQLAVVAVEQSTGKEYNAEIKFN